jgi:tetratricopeptide (TPR) repeat protein
MKIPKFILIFLLSALWQLGYAQTDFNSVQEVLDFETAQIAVLGSADSYINRAESYLLCQNYDLALSDLEVGYQLSQDIEDHPTLYFRSLFGLAIVYANIDELEKFNAVVSSIETLLDAHKCTGCSEKQHSVELCSYVKLLVSDDPEPERISVEACIEKANNTARYARILIDKSHPAAQVVLNALVNRLTNKAIKCCIAGGLWKGCIQPLATKWHEWNEKWKIFDRLPTLHRPK